MEAASLKRFRRGTHRLVSPAATMSRVKPLFGPMGITRVANVTGLDCVGIPVVMVCRPNSRSLAVSQGKGVDIEAARASGVMEAIELFHAERIAHPLKLASWNELRFSHPVAPVESLPRVSISVFHPNRKLLWIEGMDLLGAGPMWLPYELVHADYTMPLPTGSGCFVLSSNGLASGNHLLEAVSHGLCEVIERDAITVFRCRSVDEQESLRVDLSTQLDAEVRRLLDLFERAGVAVGVWDATSDVQIPVFQCVIIDREASPFRPLASAEGMGCHPVREVALLRALTEAAQARLTVIAGSRDDNGRRRYGTLREDDVVRRTRERLMRTGHRRFDRAPSYENDTLDEDVALILGKLRGAGLVHAWVVDLTKPEFDIPVARVVVPGLETYYHVPGYVPGIRAQRVLESRAKESRA
jgi:ribosomal protein S12 methylthiotransferase accessory factor